MHCINLQQRFGDRYKITFDPAYSPRNVRHDNLDPWMMLLEFRGGNIYPHGGDTLAVEVEGRPSIRKRLAKLDGLTLHQEGERFQSWKFPVESFDSVAEIVQPRRRRIPSEPQREILRERGAPYRFQSRRKNANLASISRSDGSA